MGWSLSDIGNAVSNRAQAARDALSHGVDAVTSTASSAARSVTTTVTRTATTVASTARDLGTAARDRAVDLGRAGMDLGRRGVEAVRDFDVREAAATARQGLSTATEAARDGITTATEWSSARVGDAADYARSHVTGDDLASRAFRGLVTGAESTTRFQLGVAGGITREVASTVGAVGQLAVTATEMQVSQEARVEYGTAIVNGVADAGRAAGGYVESVARDPSRLADDAQGAWDATGGFVGDTASRYGQAIREGRTEEIGMDVGTVATYVVPVGGGPARGALTAAVREGGEALVRGGGEAIVRTTVREGGEASVRATAETALRTGPGVAERNGAALVQRITEAGGTAPLPQGAGRIADVAAASRVSGREVAVYRDGATGTRQITLGHADSVTVPAGSRIVAHTQPGVGPAALTPSAADVTGLSRLGQGSSAIIDQAGNVARFRADDVAAQGARAAPGEAVTFQAPRTVSFADGGSITYGALDHLGRPTGVTARITPDMIGAGTHANPSILPPGWSGNGILHNEARGHLLGRQLGGSGDLPENLVTLQQRPANSPVMSGFEGQVRRAVEGGEIVDYASTPVNVGNELVPRGITLEATGTNGFDLGVTVLNPAGRARP